MYATLIAVLLLQGMIEAYPLDALVQMHRLQLRDAIFTGKLKLPQIEVVPVAFYRFK